MHLEVHVSFNVKYRHTVFDNYAFRARCAELLAAAAASIGVVIVEMGFDRDHVHMVLRLRSTHSLSGVAKTLKGGSARALLTEFPEIKKRFFWGSGLWSGALFGDSVGREPDAIRAYVRNQGKPRAPAMNATRPLAAYWAPPRNTAGL